MHSPESQVYFLPNLHIESANDSPRALAGCKYDQLFLPIGNCLSARSSWLVLPKLSGNTKYLTHYPMIFKTELCLVGYWKHSGRAQGSSTRWAFFIQKHQTNCDFNQDINLNAFDLDTLKIIVRILMIASLQDEKGNYAKGIGKNIPKLLK